MLAILNTVPLNPNPVPLLYTCEVLNVENTMLDVPNVMFPVGALTMNAVPTLTVPALVKK